MFTKEQLVGMYQSWSYDLENTHHCDPEYLEIQRAGEDITRFIEKSGFTYEEIENAADDV
jgi:hypothetical protein